MKKANHIPASVGHPLASLFIDFVHQAFTFQTETFPTPPVPPELFIRNVVKAPFAGRRKPCARIWKPATRRHQPCKCKAEGDSRSNDWFQVMIGFNGSMQQPPLLLLAMPPSAGLVPVLSGGRQTLSVKPGGFAGAILHPSCLIRGDMGEFGFPGDPPEDSGTPRTARPLQQCCPLWGTQQRRHNTSARRGGAHAGHRAANTRKECIPRSPHAQQEGL